MPVEKWNLLTEHANGSSYSFNHVPKRNDDWAHIQGDNEFMPSFKTHSDEGN